MILKLKSSCELLTNNGRKSFRPGSYNIEKEEIVKDHWFLLGLVQGGQAEILKKDSAPVFKHLPNSEAARKQPEPIDLGKPFSWDQVVGKEEAEKVEEIIPEQKAEEKVVEEVEEIEQPIKVEIKKEKLRRKK
jgi:hypothetical protein